MTPEQTVTQQTCQFKLTPNPTYPCCDIQPK